jgi:hypothetical protein
LAESQAQVTQDYAEAVNSQDNRTGKYRPVSRLGSLTTADRQIDCQVSKKRKKVHNQLGINSLSAQRKVPISYSPFRKIE